MGIKLINIAKNIHPLHILVYQLLNSFALIICVATALIRSGGTAFPTCEYCGTSTLLLSS